VTLYVLTLTECWRGLCLCCLLVGI